MTHNSKFLRTHVGGYLVDKAIKIYNFFSFEGIGWLKEEEEE